MTKLFTLSFVAILFCFKAYSQEQKTNDTAIVNTRSNSDSEINQIFTTIEVQAEFPGGVQGWSKYLMRNLKADVPVINGAPVGRYTVYVNFIVDKDGSISNVKAESDPGYGTAEEAVRVIKKGPNWKPGMQNGKTVRSYRRQPIVFLLTEK